MKQIQVTFGGGVDLGFANQLRRMIRDQLAAQPPTPPATTVAVATILGRRVDHLTAAIREAITALEHDEEQRASGSVQHVIDLLREALCCDS